MNCLVLRDSSVLKYHSKLPISFENLLSHPLRQGSINKWGAWSCRLISFFLLNKVLLYHSYTNSSTIVYACMHCNACIVTHEHASPTEGFVSLQGQEDRRELSLPGTRTQRLPECTGSCERPSNTPRPRTLKKRICGYLDLGLLSVQNWKEQCLLFKPCNLWNFCHKNPADWDTKLYFSCDTYYNAICPHKTFLEIF